MGNGTIHLIGPAASCRPFINALGLDNTAELIELVRADLGSRYRVTANSALIEASENELQGGRRDDERRAHEIETALADDDVVALLSIRGGAWLTRVLPRIDFSVLDRRRRSVTVIGFSELTTLVNIVADHPMGVGLYDMGPAFLSYGLRRHAQQQRIPSPDEWASKRLRPELGAFLRDVAGMLDGKPSARSITAGLVRGQLPDRGSASFVGGNLVVLSTLIGSRFEHCVRPTGKWLVLEEINEKPERIDRFLAHLTLAGFWKQCEGLLLGDFHRKENQLTQAVIELLRFHLPADRDIPILVTEQVGHIWPLSPLPLHREMTFTRNAGGSFQLRWPQNASA